MNQDEMIAQTVEIMKPLPGPANLHSSLWGWIRSVHDTGYERRRHWETPYANVYLYQNDAEGKMLMLSVRLDGHWVAFYPMTHGQGDKVTTVGDACNGQR